MSERPSPLVTEAPQGPLASQRRRTSMLTIVLAAVIVVLDQITKWCVLALVMQPPRVISLLPVLNLILTFNRGISFGMLRGQDQWGPWLLSALAVGVVVWLFLWQRRSGRRWIAAAVGLIMGGALGNVADRLYQQAVTDFIDFHWGGYHFPAFNLADSAITVGVAILLAEALFTRPEKPNT